MVGPGTRPSYVHAERTTPGATSMSFGWVAISCSRTRQGDGYRLVDVDIVFGERQRCHHDGDR